MTFQVRFSHKVHTYCLKFVLVEAGIKENTQLKSDGAEMGNPWPGKKALFAFYLEFLF